MSQWDVAVTVAPPRALLLGEAISRTHYRPMNGTLWVAGA